MKSKVPRNQVPRTESIQPARKVAGLLGRRRETAAEREEQAAKEHERSLELKRLGQEFEKRKRRSIETGEKIEDIVQSILPEDSLRDKKSGLKYGEASFKTHSQQGEGSIAFAYHRADTKYYGQSATTVTVVEPSDQDKPFTRQVEVLDHGFNGVTLTEDYPRGSIYSRTTLSSSDFELPGEYRGIVPRQFRRVDLADVCLYKVQAAQRDALMLDAS